VAQFDGTIAKASLFMSTLGLIFYFFSVSNEHDKNKNWDLREVV